MGQEGESGEEMMAEEWSERCHTVRWKSGTGKQGCRQPMCVCSVIQSHPTLCDPKDRSPSKSSVHGIFPARILEWVAISFSMIPAWPTANLNLSGWILNFVLALE